MPALSAKNPPASAAEVRLFFFGLGFSILAIFGDLAIFSDHQIIHLPSDQC